MQGSIHAFCSSLNPKAIMVPVRIIVQCRISYTVRAFSACLVYCWEKDMGSEETIQQKFLHIFIFVEKKLINDNGCNVKCFSLHFKGISVSKAHTWESLDLQDGCKGVTDVQDLCELQNCQVTMKGVEIAIEVFTGEQHDYEQSLVARGSMRIQLYIACPVAVFNTVQWHTDADFNLCTANVED